MNKYAEDVILLSAIKKLDPKKQQDAQIVNQLYQYWQSPFKQLCNYYFGWETEESERKMEQAFAILFRQIQIGNLSEYLIAPLFFYLLKNAAVLSQQKLDWSSLKNNFYKDFEKQNGIKYPFFRDGLLVKCLKTRIGEQILGRLMEAWKPYVSAIPQKLGQSYKCIESVFNGSCMEIWEGIQKESTLALPLQTQLKSFLYNRVKARFIDELRKDGRLPASIDLSEIQHPVQELNSGISAHSEKAFQLKRLIYNILGKEALELIQLKLEQEWPFDDIAEYLQLKSAAAAKKRYQRTRKKIARLLQIQNYLKSQTEQLPFDKILIAPKHGMEDISIFAIGIRSNEPPSIIGFIRDKNKYPSFEEQLEKYIQCLKCHSKTIFLLNNDNLRNIIQQQLGLSTAVLETNQSHLIYFEILEALQGYFPRFLKSGSASNFSKDIENIVNLSPIQ